MTKISAAAGSAIYIGPVNSTAEDVTDYSALSYTKIGGAGSIGDFGPSAALITFEGLDDEYVTKAKGIRNAGNAQVTVAWDPLDAGQQAVVAAEGTKFLYAFKVEAADAADANDPDSVWYFKALVMSANNTGRGGPNNVLQLVAGLEISGKILPVPSHSVP